MLLNTWFVKSNTEAELQMILIENSSEPMVKIISKIKLLLLVNMYSKKYKMKEVVVLEKDLNIKFLLTHK